jgi:hypothetical protein
VQLFRRWAELGGHVRAWIFGVAIVVCVTLSLEDGLSSEAELGCAMMLTGIAGVLHLKFVDRLTHGHDRTESITNEAVGDDCI